MHAPLPTPPRRSGWAATRRTLLVGGGAAVGLAIGWAVWPRHYPVNLPERPGTHILNAWLRIGEDGRVVIVCPQAEMGQGTHSGMAQLVADELGADWRSVEVEPAPLSPLYANRAMFDDALAEVPAMLKGAARWATHTLAERFDLQLTGGSTSLRSFDRTLREAGATARVLLCKAAAEKWRMDWRECRTANGFVVGGANRARFADLAAAAAEQSPPDSLDLKTLPAVGPARPRLDLPAKVNGSAVYGLDVRLPGMVYAAIRNGPAGDRGQPGLPAGVPGGAMAVVRGPGWAAVVADRWYAAKLAAETLEPKWQATAGLAEQTVIEAALRRAVEDGATLEGAGRLIEAHFSVPYAAHAPLEPANATARITGEKIEVWAPTQSTSLLTDAVARALGVDAGTVTVYPTLLGGGFGRKCEVDAAVQAALIAREVKRPVQLIWSREEEMRSAPLRPATAARYQARLDGQGRILALHARIANQGVMPSFAARNMPAIAGDPAKADDSALEGLAALPYAIGKLSAEHAPVVAPVPVTFWRSVGNSYTGFMTERFVDLLAGAAGQDPLAYRMKLLEGSPRHRALLEKVAARAGYQPGMGVALHSCFGSVVAVVAECTLSPEPGVSRITAGIDSGRVVAPDSVRQQVEGSVVWALSAAFGQPMTFHQGFAQQTNFDGYPLVSLEKTPDIDILLAPDPAYPMGGVGEPGVPPVAPAVANAFAALARRPFNDLPLRFA